MAQPTITVVDNANGTGAQVTVSGTDPASTNTVLLALTDRIETTGYVVTPFTRTGDGPIQVTLGSEDGSTLGVNLTHAWFVQVTNSLSGLTSAASIVTPTNGLVTPHFQAMCAVQRNLIGENIGRIAGRIYRCEDPVFFLPSVQSFPAILLSPPDPEQRASQSNLLSLWTFPILVSIVDKDASWYKQTEWHLWAKWFAMSFADRMPLAFGNGQPGKIRRAIVAPRTGISPAGDQYQYQISSFALNCECDRNVGKPGN